VPPNLSTIHLSATRERYLNQPGVYIHKIVNPLPFPDFAPALPDLQKKRRRDRRREGGCRAENNDYP
jgi:hypothetical protein